MLLKFSIITPSYNQREFITECIESVLNQNYDNYEHIVFDGGSTDNTVSILKSYKHLIWKSEKDTGAANAINKGFSMASGDILVWLNTDDYFEKNIFHQIAEVFNKNKDIEFVYGNLTFIKENKEIIVFNNTANYSLDILLNYCPDIIRQPSSFFRKSLLNKVGKLDESLKCVFDYDLFIRMLKVTKFYHIDNNFVFQRTYPDSLSVKFRRKQGLEIIKVSRRHGGKLFSRLLLSTIYRKILFPKPK